MTFSSGKTLCRCIQVWFFLFFFVLAACFIHVPAVSAQGEDVLYYADYHLGTDYMLAALNAQGFNVTQATSWADFNDQLNVSSYPLAVAFNQNSGLGANFAIVETYLADGGRVIFTDWTRNVTYVALFEASYTGSNNQTPVTITEPTLAEGIENPMGISSPGWGTWAMGLSATGGGQSLATFPNNDDAIVLGNEGRTAILGFLGDTPPAADGQRFFENLLDLVQGVSEPDPDVLPEPDDDPGLFYLMINRTGEGSTTPSSRVTYYEPGSEVTIKASPAAGWLFDRWVVDGKESYTEEVQVTMYLDRIIHAYFVEKAMEEPDPTPKPEPKDPLDPAQIEVMMWIGSTTYTVDDVPAAMDGVPFIEEGRTFVPVRFVASAFGLDADWGPQDGLTEWVIFENDAIRIEIEIGSAVITVIEGGTTYTIMSDVAAQIVNDRTYLPIRAVGEILGAEFDWGPKETTTDWVKFTYWK